MRTLPSAAPEASVVKVPRVVVPSSETDSVTPGDQPKSSTFSCLPDLILGGESTTVPRVVLTVRVAVAVAPSVDEVALTMCTPREIAEVTAKGSDAAPEEFVVTEP